MFCEKSMYLLESQKCTNYSIQRIAKDTCDASIKSRLARTIRDRGTIWLDIFRGYVWVGSSFVFLGFIRPISHRGCIGGCKFRKPLGILGCHTVQTAQMSTDLNP